ncbi:MAG: HAD family phosphatase [Psychrilyobacter sp.]|uniref:HAD family hydrolase n=1 Tax=Psychrilyobacter sp. TaxID=2586924 RepID=UPI003C769D74
MIKNIVFDLGMVLINFNPKEFLEINNYEKKEKIMEYIFGHEDWLKLDRGTLTEKELAEKLDKNGSFTYDEVMDIMKVRKDIMIPFDFNKEIPKKLKEKGYNLYILSNFPKIPFEEIKERDEFFRYFDGGVVSAYVKHLKPEKAIYETLLSDYFLNPEETIFIDDKLENIRSAEELGISGIHLKTPESLKGKLIGLKLL